MSNEIDLISGSEGVSHNGIFRGKNLGTISNLNEYLAFRLAHGIDDNSYKDLYLGDYFKINDGTYNKEWIVAHFDYYWNKGSSDIGPYSSRGVVLISRVYCTTTAMATENKTTGGYKASLAHTTTCPAIANALQTVLGSYLLSAQKNMSTAISETSPSMAGAGRTGCSSSYAWTLDRCVLPSELQVYGCNVASSSFYDVGGDNQKLAVFNFINTTEFANDNFWLRNVVSSAQFALAGAGGTAYSANASITAYKIRPLIYIG